MDKDNEKWWTSLKDNLGIITLVNRTRNDFDPATNPKYLIPLNQVSSFLSRVIGFQIFRSLCILAKEFYESSPRIRPLHMCNLYGSKLAGSKLRSALSSGSSQPLMDVLRELTGEQNISTSAVVEYFSPLQDLLWKKVEEREFKYLFKMPEVGAGESIAKYLMYVIFSILILGLLFIIGTCIYVRLWKLKCYWAISRNR